MTYKMRVLQQTLEQEEAAHKASKARLVDENKIYQSIEEAKSEAMKGEVGPAGWGRDLLAGGVAIKEG